MESRVTSTTNRASTSLGAEGGTVPRGHFPETGLEMLVVSLAGKCNVGVASSGCNW